MGKAVKPISAQNGKVGKMAKSKTDRGEKGKMPKGRRRWRRGSIRMAEMVKPTSALKW